MLLELFQVVLLMADDVAAADIAALPTPHIDALAAQGTTYSRTYSMPACAPTRATMFFGQYWARFYTSACIDPSNDLIQAPEFSPQRLSMAEFFSGERRMIGKWHLGSPWLDASQVHGFTSTRAQSAAAPNHCNPQGMSLSYDRWLRVDDGVQSVHNGYATHAQVAEAVQWLQAPQPDHSFLYVAFNAAHSPFHVPPGYPEVKDDERRFQAMVQTIDDAVGAILAEVDLSTTWVLFTSDNGTPESVAPVEGKAKQTTFERGVRVPLIVAGPGFTPGVSTDRLSHVVDLYPTLYRMAGGSGSPATDGIALQEREGHDFVYMGHRRPRRDEQAVCDGRYKLRSFAPDNILIDPTVGPQPGQLVRRLYDLELDPDEELPQTSEHPEWGRMAALLNSVIQYEDPAP